MAYMKTIVCLANSYKPPNGRCIAGKEITEGVYGDWIRPVSEREKAELSFSDYCYKNRGIPKLLDVIEVPLSRPDPRAHQVENHVIDATRSWVKKGELSRVELEHLRDQPPSIWINSDHTSQGHYDCISQAEAATLRSSLLLIKKNNFTVVVARNPFSGKRIYRGDFNYKGTHHNFSLTDPVVRNAFESREEGDYPLHDVYICLSLTEPFSKDGRCHKLVAAVI